MCRIGNSKADQGMTLLELLVVLVIASLMLTLVAPNIANVLPGSELKAFARQSAALLRELRSEAVGQSRIRRIGVDVDSRSLVSDGKTVAFWPDGVEVRLNENALPTQWRSPFDDQPHLQFYPDGSSNGGALELTAPERLETRYFVTVESLTGGVKIDAE